MKIVLHLCFGLAIITINACASFGKITPDNQPSINARKGLSAQKFDAGECGIFLWDRHTPRTFVFFHKKGDLNAKYYTQDTEITIKIKKEINNMGEGEGFSYEYIGSDAKTILLQGIFTDTLDGGRRISQARIKSQTTENWEEILPVSGVYACS